MPNPYDPREVLHDVAGKLGARKTGEHAYVLEELGRRFVLELSGQRQPAVLLGLDASGTGGTLRRGPFPVVFRREGRLDRWGKRWKLNAELQTGDADFDRAVYVEADRHREQVRAWLGSPLSRQAIRALLDAGFGHISYHPGERSLILTPKGGVPGLEARLFSVEGARWAMATLSQLASTMPAAAFDSAMPVRRTAGETFMVALLIASLVGFWVGVIGLLVMPWTAIDDWLYVVGGLVGVGAWALSLPLQVLSVRGTSTAMSRLLGIGLFSLFASPQLGALGLSIVNCGLDPDEKQVIRKVRDVSFQRHTKGGTSTWIHVDSWRGPKRELRLRYTSSLHVYPGDRALIGSGPGLLGWSWHRSSIRLERED